MSEPVSKSSKYNPYSFAFKVIEAAEKLIKISRLNPGNEKTSVYVGLLSMLEQNIDYSRALVKPNTSFKYPDRKQELEKRMDNLRKQIAELAEKTDYAELQETLESFANGVRTNFLFNAKKA